MFVVAYRSVKLSPTTSMVLLSPASFGPISTPWMVVFAASTKIPSVPKLFVASVVIVASVKLASVMTASAAVTPISLMPGLADPKNRPNW